MVRLSDQQGLEDQPCAQADGGDLDRQQHPEPRLLRRGGQALRVHVHRAQLRQWLLRRLRRRRVRTLLPSFDAGCSGSAHSCLVAMLLLGLNKRICSPT